MDTPIQENNYMVNDLAAQSHQEHYPGEVIRAEDLGNHRFLFNCQNGVRLLRRRHLPRHRWLLRWCNFPFAANGPRASMRLHWRASGKRPRLHIWALVRVGISPRRPLPRPGRWWRCKAQALGNQPPHIVLKS